MSSWNQHLPDLFDKRRLRVKQHRGGAAIIVLVGNYLRVKTYIFGENLGERSLSKACTEDLEP